jgi:hypothetical protein
MKRKEGTIGKNIQATREGAVYSVGSMADSFNEGLSLRARKQR